MSPPGVGIFPLRIQVSSPEGDSCAQSIHVHKCLSTKVFFFFFPVLSCRSLLCVPILPPFMILAFSKHFFLMSQVDFGEHQICFADRYVFRDGGRDGTGRSKRTAFSQTGKLVHFVERGSVWPLLPFQVIGVSLCGGVLPTRPQGGGSLVLRVWFWGPKVACVWSCLLTW